MARKKKVKPKKVKLDEPTMKHPCCDRSWITYPYLNPTYCVNCGAMRVDVPKFIAKPKKVKKRRVPKVEVDKYGDRV